MMSPSSRNVLGGTMRTRTASTALACLLLATLTACGGEEEPDRSAASKSASPSSSPTKTYTFEDCKDLLEYDYQAGESKDASADPECSHLTEPEYHKAVGEVLAAHKNDFLEQGARRVVWDEAWKKLPSDKQIEICDQLDRYGADAVGKQLKESGAGPEGHEAEMARYIDGYKC